MVANRSVSSAASASLIVTSRVTASIRSTAPPMSVKGTYTPASVSASEWVIRLANHSRIAAGSPKILSKTGRIESRSSRVSLTSKTMTGRSDMGNLSFIGGGSSSFAERKVAYLGSTVNPSCPSTLTAPDFPPSKSPEASRWPVANS